MIIQFSVSNYRSFGRLETLSLVPGSRDESHPEHLVPLSEEGTRAVRAAVVYGANGAGKSNLYRAMLFLRNLALGDVSRDGRIQLPTFKFAAQDSQESDFRIVFASAGGIYGYSVKIGAGMVLEESLEKRIGGRMEPVFLRIFSNGESSVAIASTLNDVIPEKVKAQAFVGAVKTRTFISVVRENIASAEQRGPDVEAVIDWFQKLQFIGPEDHFAGSLLELYSKDAFRRFASVVLGRASGVDGIGMDRRKVSEEAVKALMSEKTAVGVMDSLRQNYGVVMRNGSGSEVQIDRNPDNTYNATTLTTFHSFADGRRGTLDISEESDGTKRLINLLPALYDMMVNDRVCIIDEIDRSMHAGLTRSFMRTFLRSLGRGQIVFTTHESSLLDVDLFRRDEIWFAEKDSHGMTRLFSLNDYRVRNKASVRDYYLEGRYGAVPFELDEDGVLKETLK